jgi:hypothetical protein
VHFDSKAVAMQTAAFVPLRDMWQSMCSFDYECLEYLHCAPLGNSQEFVRLKAEPPNRILKAVAHGALRV